jgi:hypothetical protein
MRALKTIQIGRDLGFTKTFKICVLMFSNPRNSYLYNKLGNIIFSVLGMGFFIEARAEINTPCTERKWIFYVLHT